LNIVSKRSAIKANPLKSGGAKLKGLTGLAPNIELFAGPHELDFGSKQSEATVS
jgi:hypothetical protein